MLGLTDKNMSFDKNDSKSLLSSSSYIQTNNGYKKLRHLDNYKDIYLDKENQLILNNKKNNSINLSEKSFNEISIDNNKSFSDIKKLKTEETDFQRKKYIRFSNDVNFNFNRENNNNNSIDSHLSKKQNNYINDNIKEQIIQKSLKKTENKTINNFNKKNKKEKIKENSNDKGKKYVKNNEKVKNSNQNPKKIKSFYSNKIENENDNSIIKSQNDGNENSFSSIKKEKDNFPYQKYEFNHSRNNLELNKSLNKKLNNKNLTDELINESNKINNNYLKNNILNSLNNYHKRSISSFSNKNINLLNTEEQFKTSISHVPSEKELKKREMNILKIEEQE